MTFEESIKFIRLSNGEDLISQIVEIRKEDEDSYYILINPLKIVYITGSKAGILSISLMQWVFHRVCSEQEFTIYPSDVITIAKPTDSLTEYYQESLEHFMEMREKLEKSTEFTTNEEEETFKDVDTNDLLDELKELITNTSSKRILH
tara:strand:+ start:426 stop:869 length:444 start_codon:yes stop_codon:yes gene_type:complete